MVGVFCGSSIKKQYLRAVLVSLDLPSPTVFGEIGDTFLFKLHLLYWAPSIFLFLFQLIS